jgi:hypothetical protein
MRTTNHGFSMRRTFELIDRNNTFVTNQKPQPKEMWCGGFCPGLHDRDGIFLSVLK